MGGGDGTERRHAPHRTGDRTGLRRIGTPGSFLQSAEDGASRAEPARATSLPVVLVSGAALAEETGKRDWIVLGGSVWVRRPVGWPLLRGREGAEERRQRQPTASGGTSPKASAIQRPGSL